MAWKRSSVRSRPGPPILPQWLLMTAIYILQSESSGRFYIGCAEDPSARLREHQRGQTISTRGLGPWILVYQEQFETLLEARSRERQLQSWKSHRSIRELIEVSTTHKLSAPRLRRGGSRFDPDQVHQSSLRRLFSLPVLSLRDGRAGQRHARFER